MKHTDGTEWGEPMHPKWYKPNHERLAEIEAEKEELVKVYFEEQKARAKDTPTSRERVVWEEKKDPDELAKFYADLLIHNASTTPPDFGDKPSPPTIPPKVNMHDIICDELHDTYIRKNADYGDSFAKFRERFPNSIMMRMFDKYLRIETLLTGAEAQVKDESIEDSLLDLANYCIMEVIERRLEAEDGR